LPNSQILEVLPAQILVHGRIKPANFFEFGGGLLLAA
jgi:hypothetical protein